MYSNTGYLLEFDLDMAYDESEEFIICSCGHYRLLTLPKLNTIRPNGRCDWQIVYIVNGFGHFLIDGIEEKIGKGTIILYPPKTQQIYYYDLEEKPEVYWIHFSGNKVWFYLEQLGLSKGFAYIGVHLELINLFEAIIKELQIKPFFYKEICKNYTNELLIKITRMKEATTQVSTTQDFFVEAFLEWVCANYKEECNISSFAAQYNISESYFIRRFKAHIGKTPMQYLIFIRISHACELLQSTPLLVNEIAEMVGYINPLYFSRLFKKIVGVSPKFYRLNSTKKKW